MPSRNDRRMILVVERSAPEVNQTDVGIIQDPFRLSRSASRLFVIVSGKKSIDSRRTYFGWCVPVPRIR